jgi:hypothetical protein
MSDRYNFTDEEYRLLRNNLNPEELGIIERFEVDCADLTIDYWEFYRKIEKYKLGIRWTPEKFRVLVASPMYQLRICLLDRAMRLRGIITR